MPEPEKDPRIENARRLYEAMQGAEFTPQTFQDLGEKGQFGCSFRELLPDTIRALLRVVDAYEPVNPSGAKGGGRKTRGTTQKEKAREAAPSAPSRGGQNASASGACEKPSEAQEGDAPSAA